MYIYTFSPSILVMAGYDKRGSSEDHIRRKEGDGEGSAGKEAEGSQLNPNDLAKLRKVFILPVKDVSLKLKRAWKVCYTCTCMYFRCTCTYVSQS